MYPRLTYQNHAKVDVEDVPLQQLNKVHVDEECDKVQQRFQRYDRIEHPTKTLSVKSIRRAYTHGHGIDAAT